VAGTVSVRAGLVGAAQARPTDWLPWWWAGSNLEVGDPHLSR
jgi:hypothetical protein